jgi:antitoxin CcdA
MATRVSSVKKATNITLSIDVLNEAKALGINISQACDHFLRVLVRREHEQRWVREYASFVTAYNRTVEQDGLPLDEWRTF